MLEPVLFENVQRVHVGAQADGALARSNRQGTHHAGAAQSPVYAQPEGLELFCHQSGGTLLLERRFRVGMDVVPPFRHFSMQCTDFFKNRHLAPLSVISSTYSKSVLLQAFGSDTARLSAIEANAIIMSRTPKKREQL